MFKMTPAVEWLERDYDTLTRLKYRECPKIEVSDYAGLRHFEAEGRWHSQVTNAHVGQMFSFKDACHGGHHMRWDPVVNWKEFERVWCMPLDREVRWL